MDQAIHEQLKANDTDQILHDTKAFMEKIKKTEVYRIYAIAKKELDSEPALAAQVDQFRRKSFEIQTGHNYGYYNSYEQMVHLKTENDELLSKPLVRRFMDAEFRLTQMMSKIFFCMAENLDFNIQFLE